MEARYLPGQSTLVITRALGPGPRLADMHPNILPVLCFLFFCLSKFLLPKLDRRQTEHWPRLHLTVLLFLPFLSLFAFIGV